MCLKFKTCNALIYDLHNINPSLNCRLHDTTLENNKDNNK